MSFQLDSNLKNGTKYLDFIEMAVNKIMPCWTLDKSIAVNPWHTQTNEKFSEVINKISTISKANLCHPSGLIKKNISRASGDHFDDDSAPMILRAKSIVDIADGVLLSKDVSWRDLMINNISNECSYYYSNRAQEVDDTSSLYSSWIEHSRVNLSLELLSGVRGLLSNFSLLPKNPYQAIDIILSELDIEIDNICDYLHMMLLDILGWASYTSYLKWTANLNQEAYAHDIENLLACRLAWEYLLYKHYQDKSFKKKLDDELKSIYQKIQHNKKAFAINQKIIEETENKYQKSLFKKISYSLKTQCIKTKPVAQAVFCIDVRSERMRRAIETLNPQIETKGFAGFFGLPISYQPTQLDKEFKLLPALIPACFIITDDGNNPKYEESRITLKNIKSEIFNNVSSMFTSVEMAGAAYGLKMYNELIKDITLNDNQYTNMHPVKLSLNKKDKIEVEVETKVEICNQVLKGMSLTDNFAPFIFIIGHGAECANNPHKSTLHCGACGGQSGELNAQLLTSLLNDNKIRKNLVNKGIYIPSTTAFIPAIHNTTTDEIVITKPDMVIDDESIEFKKVKEVFGQAQVVVQKERLKQFNSINPATTNQQEFYLKRSKLPSEVRPEWGLVNNASFIIGPRNFTKNINLNGRAFLHDYQERLDIDGSVLNSIMTAPMVVASWINLQYFASTVDNNYYGAGNKVLHNVVGGNIGVIEGSSGDLRIGLPWQSVHDGNQYMHDALRLHVIIYASTSKIDAVLSANPSIKNLFDNQWLHLFQCNEQTGAIFKYEKNTWYEVSTF